MPFFGSLGRLIVGSGGPYVITETEVIAPGSIMKFLKGKMYNRCRRAHILFSAAMHGLHFQRFMTDEGIDERTKRHLKKWALADDNSEVPNDLQMLVRKHELYCDDTLMQCRTWENCSILVNVL